MPADPESRIRRYRLLAEEIRTAGEGMQTGSRQDLFRIADNYELMADQLERLHLQRKPKPQTG
jgi:hypothetical protein